MKNCDRGLENAARGRRPRAAFSSLRSQFFTIQTDPKPVNNLFIFFLLLGSSILSHSELAGRNRSVSGQDRKFLPAPGTNQIAGFREFRPLTSQEKNKSNILYVISIHVLYYKIIINSFVMTLEVSKTNKTDRKLYPETLTFDY